jgi:transmembrane sensor
MGTGSPTGETPGRGNGWGARRPASIADEAAEWLATLTDAASTDEERQSFVTWLRRSNLHVEEFLRISTLARRLTAPGCLPPADVGELVRRAKQDLSGAARVTDMAARSTFSESTPRAPQPCSPDPRGAPNSRRSRHLPLRWAIAACVAAVAIVALTVARYGLLDVGTPTYSTSLGELRSITLEDGSIVELNTRSTLRTRFTAAERRVELLSGEAVFKVAKNPARPFRVVAGSAQIVAVGTAFNVYAQSARTVVTVLEGRVRVRGQGALAEANRTPALAAQEVELARGEQAIVAPHARIAKATLADPQRVTSWTERRLVFEETPLAEAAAEFMRYNSQAIRINDSTLGELHITGVFDATDPASLVQFVEAYGSVAVHLDQHGWTLSRVSEGTPEIEEPRH